MKKTKKKFTRPQPPADIQDDALAEWDRVCTEIEATGREVKPADRSILALYCRTWAANQKCYEHIRSFGPIIKWPNGLPGPSPQYKVFKETATLMQKQLHSLGCTPESRDFDEVEAAAPEPLGELKF